MRQFEANHSILQELEAAEDKVGHIIAHLDAEEVVAERRETIEKARRKRRRRVLACVAQRGDWRAGE